MPLSTEYVRKCIDEQSCPWCGRGPFEKLPIHVARIHGIRAVVFRDIAGLDHRGQLSSDSAVAKAKERAEKERFGEMVSRLRRGVPAPPQSHPRYITAAGKAAIAQRHATQHRPRGEEHKRSVLKEQQVRDIRSRAADGMSQANLAAEFGVSRRTVQLIIQRKKWKWLV